MKINILLPYKEQFDVKKASSVSITVKNNLFYSNYKKHIKVFGRNVENPISKKNFVPVEKPLIIFKSKNKLIAEHMASNITESQDDLQLVEIHNRPYLFNYLYNKLNKYPLSIFFHNDPQSMRGSKSIKEREKILLKCENIFCVSKFVRKKFVHGLKGNISKVKILNNGVNRNISKFPKKKLDVLFVGRLVPEKGISLFVNAVEKISHEFPDWSFSIIGSSKLGEADKKDSFAFKITHQFNNIGKQANFKGFQSYDKTQKEMQKSSILVIPSTWNEPFGLVAAEGMSNGMAIIASSVGGLTEIIGKNGILINNINENKLILALKDLMSNKILLKKYQRLSWENFSLDSKSISKKLDSYRQKSLVKLLKS